MANPDLVPGRLQKDPKGTHWIKGRERRKAVRKHEDEQKALVRARDGRCRWPHCENCRAFKPRLEVAHLVAKGQGGDHGTRSTADQMVLLDFLTHQSGPLSLEQHGRRIVPLTPAGTNGPCEFWQRDEDGVFYLVAAEVAIGIYRRD
jgi:hypothetical protein